MRCEAKCRSVQCLDSEQFFGQRSSVEITAGNEDPNGDRKAAMSSSRNTPPPLTRKRLEERIFGDKRFRWQKAR
ncbi:unnamed protein product [Nippostrongylus brasiliensis]|uniref:Uncharacterized protein n=1 Tax=Nippostrongylus brasiliensis TaxID=27835 RepID=A0A0N4YFQ2_NIPBR|nr:unnamed protein product [Nippostrongylus brasiliensis]